VTGGALLTKTSRSVNGVKDQPVTQQTCGTARVAVGHAVQCVRYSQSSCQVSALQFVRYSQSSCQV